MSLLVTQQLIFKLEYLATKLTKVRLSSLMFQGQVLAKLFDRLKFDVAFGAFAQFVRTS